MIPETKLKLALIASVLSITLIIGLSVLLDIRRQRVAEQNVQQDARLVALEDRATKAEQDLKNAQAQYEKDKADIASTNDLIELERRLRRQLAELER